MSQGPSWSEEGLTESALHLSDSSVPRGEGQALCGLGQREEARLRGALRGHEAHHPPGSIPAARHRAGTLGRRQTN